MASVLDTAVIGAGQAGLAAGFYLAQQRASFALLEAGAAVGSAWKGRYASLKLFTPARYSGLPGLAFPGDPDAYPERDAVVDYLAHYAQHFELPIHPNMAVQRLSRVGKHFEVQTTQGLLHARRVVVCSGPFQTPQRPDFAAALSPEVQQRHVADYRRPSDIASGPVLVVGAGNSGAWIALELAKTHPVSLALGHRPRSLPQRLWGRDLFWWLERLKLERISPSSTLGQRLRRAEPLIGLSLPTLERAGVRLRPRAVGVEGAAVRFADGALERFQTVLWATGYRSDYRWIDLPIFDASGRVQHRGGLTVVPGLGFLGLSWQRSRYSALLGGVGRDAGWLLERLGREEGSR